MEEVVDVKYLSKEQKKLIMKVRKVMMKMHQQISNSLHPNLEDVSDVKYLIKEKKKLIIKAKKVKMHYASTNKQAWTF